MKKQPPTDLDTFAVVFATLDNLHRECMQRVLRDPRGDLAATWLRSAARLDELAAAIAADVATTPRAEAKSS